MRGRAALLLALYALQGVPFGMITGSLPVLLQARGAGYAELGWLSLAAIPFSTKVLVSPLVDAWFWPAAGRRKSWIIPCTLLSGALFAALATQVDALADGANVRTIAAWLFAVVLALSFQDVAVDAWAVPLLGAERAAFASSCQTLGMTGGNVLGYPLVLALCDADLSLRLFGEARVLPLSAVLWAAAGAHALVAAAVLLVREAPPSAAERALTVRAVFSQLRALVTGPAHARQSRTLFVFAMLHRLGAMHLDCTSLVRFVELGGQTDQLSGIFLAQMPLVVAASWLAAARISSGAASSLDVTMRGYAVLLLAGALLPAALAYTVGDDGAVSAPELALLCLVFTLSSLGNKLFFTAQGAFFNTIADPLVAGTHLTLLNATFNLGRIWARYPTFWATEAFGYDAVATACVMAGVVLYRPMRGALGSAVKASDD